LVELLAEERVEVLVEMMAASLADGKAEKKVVLLVHVMVYVMVESLAVKWEGLRDERLVEKSDIQTVGMWVVSKVG
jgi:hypothetical protein